MKCYRVAEFLEEKTEAGYKLSSSRLFSFILIVSFNINWMHDIFTIGKFNPEYSIIALIFGVLGLRIFNKKVEKK